MIISIIQMYTCHIARVGLGGRAGTPSPMRTAADAVETYRNLQETFRILQEVKKSREEFLSL